MGSDNRIEILNDEEVEAFKQRLLRQLASLYIQDKAHQMLPEITGVCEQEWPEEIPG